VPFNSLLSVKIFMNFYANFDNFEHNFLRFQLICSRAFFYNFNPNLDSGKGQSRQCLKNFLHILPARLSQTFVLVLNEFLNKKIEISDSIARLHIFIAF